MTAEEQSARVPGVVQTLSLVLGQVTTDGFVLDTLLTLLDPPAVVANAAQVRHRMADA